MNLKKYEKFTEDTDRTLNSHYIDQLLHYSTGLSAEVGETLALFQNTYHYQKGYNNSDICNELGDVLWYVTRLANLHGISLEEILEGNIKKLTERGNCD